MQDMTIDKLTQEVYDKAKSEAEKVFNLEKEVGIPKEVVIAEFIEGLIEDVVENLYSSKFDSYEELNQFELASIKDNIIRDRDYREMLINGTFVPNILELYKEILDNRIKYFKYRVPYSGEIEIIVKAHDEDEPRDYIESMSHYSLCQLVNDYDVEFDYFDMDLDDIYDDEPFEDYEDAT